MTIRDALLSDTVSRGDAEILLADLLQRDRTWILAHEMEAIPAELEAMATDWMQRRSRGEPVAYITGKKEFFGRMFSVDPSVLIPRPATEQLVALALDILSGKEKAQKVCREIDNDIVAYACMQGDMSGLRTVADIGTGSGCIAVTLACERPDLRIIATDTSESALKIAEENATQFSVADRIFFQQGRGLEPLEDLVEPFLIVSNPPYIPLRTTLERDVQDFEPDEALFGGGEGSEVIDAIVTAAAKHPFCRGWVIECMASQAKNGIERGRGKGIT